MAKETGITMTLSVDDSAPSLRDISNSVTDFDFATPRNVMEVTGLDKSGMERLLLLADFSITVNGVFDDGSNLAHAVFKTVSSTSVVRTTTIVVSGQTLTNESFYTDYALTRAASGELTFSAPGVLTGGVVPAWS